MNANEKVRERRLRRAAERQGLRLERSRARDPHALTYGTYQLTDPHTNTIVAAGRQSGYGLDLDQVETYLNDRRPNPRPAEPFPTGDLRRQDVEGVLRHAESCLDTELDRTSLVRKRRSLGARSDRGTWVRIEARPLAKIAAQGQAGNGMEAASYLRGIAAPGWYRGSSWLDKPNGVVWRADEVELVAAAPMRSGGTMRNDPLPDAWWVALNAALDSLAQQHTTRVATPDTEPITQDLVTADIERAFPGQVDTTIIDHEWVPAHADLNWSNLTAPDCWILDWEDHGLAPRGLDAATLWVDSLLVPELAERVHAERRADLETRSGKVMALWYCSKVINDSGAAGTPMFEATSRVAAKLVADLQR